MSKLHVLDIGLKKYLEVLALQEELFNRNIDLKLRNQTTKHYLILCQHEPVFTLGKSGKRENILVSDEEMNAEFYRVNRGGDVTFHGPGQLVVYPILDLENLHIGLAEYIHRIEETIIQLLNEFGVTGERIEGAAGIWLRGHIDRKICAIGVKASRNVTMHGLALNVNTDLSYFNKIIACGLEGKETTSLYKELNEEITMASVIEIFIHKFCRVFSMEYDKISVV